MSALTWDTVGQREYETGADHGVLFPYDTKTSSYGDGVAWNGLTGVTQSPSGADANATYADNIKYLNIRGTEDFGFTIKAYTYPDEWSACDGSKELAKGVTIGQQKRSMFGFCYRTIKGNDTEENDHGYVLHLIYGGTASPSERDYQTVNDSPEALELSWECSTTPVNVAGFKPTALVEVDSTKVDATKLAALEKILYGDSDAQPRLPLPDEIKTLMATA